MTIFKKVSVEERLPKENGWYMIFLANTSGVHTKLEWIGWWNDDGTEIRHVTYWLEEVELPSDKEIDNTFPLQYGMDILNFNADCRKGAKWMRDYISK